MVRSRVDDKDFATFKIRSVITILLLSVGMLKMFVSTENKTQV